MRGRFAQVVRVGVIAIALVMLDPVLVLGEAPPSGGLTLADVMDGVRNRNERFVSARVTIQRELYTEPLDGGGPRQAVESLPTKRLAATRKGHMIRFEQDYAAYKNAPPHTYQLAWNGLRTTTLYDEPAKSGNVRTGLVLGRRDRGAFHSSAFMTGLEEVVLELDDPLYRLFAGGNWKLIGNEAVGLNHAWHIQGAEVEQSTLNATVDAWVDPTHDFAPVRLEISIPVKDQKIFASMSDVELRQISGLWVISHARFKKLNPLVLSGRAFIEEISFVDYEVNLQVDDSEFALSFPDGTKVWDDSQKRSYIAGKGEVVRARDGSIQLVPFDGKPTPVSTKKQLAVTESAGTTMAPRNYSTYVVATIGACFAALLALAMRIRATKNRTARND